MSGIIKNKLLWMGAGIIILFTSIFTFAFMGSTVNPTPKELPVAIVMEDEGVTLPNGEQINFSNFFVEEIQKRDSSSVNWRLFHNKEEAIQVMNEKKLYATIVLQEKLSEQIFSLLTGSSVQPTTTIILNEGMNQAGVNVAAQIASGVLSNFNLQLQEKLLAQLEGLNVPLTAELVRSLSSPFTIETEKINTVAVNNANGNTPALFTQLLWISTFISSMILFTLLKKSTEGKWTFNSLVSQMLIGILYVTIISSITLLLAVHVLEVNVPSQGQLFFTLLYIGLCFFFLQNAFLNWIGYAAATLFILLLFFSMPILTIAPEMLPNVTNDFLYSWVPFRFSLETLRDVLFFKKGIYEEGIGTIGWIGLVSLTLMALSIFKPKSKQKDTINEDKQSVPNH
ncbi:YhgE/Pip domain-containing protein [Bacillus salitolerans]|uniref:YhgE/Pip domain-containing protein n=1 Tax=Bacillus salitolerans TaxID=1437434 RepID=A0ABW4LT36_9BACI